MRFEFGHHDEELHDEGTYNNPTLHSSCRTTHESPIGSRYRSCDTVEVQKTLEIYLVFVFVGIICHISHGIKNKLKLLGNSK